MGKSLSYRAVNSLKKGFNRVKGMMTRDKANYVDTSVGVARPAGFKSSVAVVNNAGKYNNRSNKNTAPSKSDLSASLAKYAGQRQNTNSRRTSNPKSKAAFEASTKAYAKRNRSNKNSKSTSDASSKAAFAASTKAYAGKNWTKF